MQFAICTKTRLSDFLLIGLQTGIVGALVMLAWLALASVWNARSFWNVPNILASTFYGDAALRQGFASTTVSGVALFLAIYGIFGALFGLAVQARGRRMRVTLLGIAAALGWYYLSFGVIWKSLNPLVVLYIHEQPMLFAHIIFGALLGRYPVYLKCAEDRKK